MMLRLAYAPALEPRSKTFSELESGCHISNLAIVAGVPVGVAVRYNLELVSTC